jgi:hypothetical protein
MYYVCEKNLEAYPQSYKTLLINYGWYVTVNEPYCFSLYHVDSFSGSATFKFTLYAHIKKNSLF